MSDYKKEIKEARERRTAEFSRRRAEARLERASSNALADREARRISGMKIPKASSLEKAGDELKRRERIRERDPLRKSPGYDAKHAIARENFETRTNPKGYIRRHLGEGHDRATERRLKKSLNDREQSKV